jgi:hypothetical protein
VRFDHGSLGAEFCGTLRAGKTAAAAADADEVECWCRHCRFRRSKMKAP